MPQLSSAAQRQGVWRWSGILLIATSVIHTGVWVAMDPGFFGELIRRGVPVTTADGALEDSLWFEMMGVMMLLLGTLAHTFIKVTDRPLPRYLGWSLMALTLGAIIYPVSGFWLFLPQGVIILLGARRVQAAGGSNAPHTKL